MVHIREVVTCIALVLCLVFTQRSSSWCFLPGPVVLACTYVPHHTGNHVYAYVILRCPIFTAECTSPQVEVDM